MYRRGMYETMLQVVIFMRLCRSKPNAFASLLAEENIITINEPRFGSTMCVLLIQNLLVDVKLITSSDVELCILHTKCISYHNVKT